MFHITVKKEITENRRKNPYRVTINGGKERKLTEIKTVDDWRMIGRCMGLSWEAEEARHIKNAVREELDSFREEEFRKTFQDPGIPPHVISSNDHHLQSDLYF